MFNEINPYKHLKEYFFMSDENYEVEPQYDVHESPERMTYRVFVNFGELHSPRELDDCFESVVSEIAEHWGESKGGHTNLEIRTSSFSKNQRAHLKEVARNMTNDAVAELDRLQPSVELEQAKKRTELINKVFVTLDKSE